MIFSIALFLLSLFYIIYIFNKLNQIRVRNRLRIQYSLPVDFKIIAFLHPYCNSGGGGERVLWTAVKSLLLDNPNYLIVIYTNDRECHSSKSSVFANIRNTFGLSVCQPNQLDRIHFVALQSQPLLSAHLYPVFTLAGQALGSLVVACEALLRCRPDFFIDTTGLAFALPIAKRLFNARTAAYVHYPTISSAMISRLDAATYNNADWIRRNPLLSRVKNVYYHFLVWTYRWVGSPNNIDLVMTNSSWTQNHILALWCRDRASTSVLYPPCPVEALLADRSVDRSNRKPWIVSVGQFRPEKNHELQLRAFARFLSSQSTSPTSTNINKKDIRLILIGGCRDEGDRQRVERLKCLTDQLDVGDQVDFHINLPYAELTGTYFAQATVNLHAMVDEHFGIGIVEGMATGLLTIAHASGGPQTDIIGPKSSQHSSNNEPVGVGFLATTEAEYADLFRLALIDMPDRERDAICEEARRWVASRFSQSQFTKGWLHQMKRLGVEPS